MTSLRERINQQWTYHGIKELGVTEAEYAEAGGSTAEYRIHTVIQIAERAVGGLLGLEIGPSQTNIDKALAAVAPKVKEN